MTSRPLGSATHSCVRLDEVTKQSRGDSLSSLLARLDAKLRERGKCMVEVDGDGNCYFHALAKTLAAEERGGEEHADTELRPALVDTLEQFWDCRLDADEAPGEPAFMYSSLIGACATASSPASASATATTALSATATTALSATATTALSATATTAPSAPAPASPKATTGDAGTNVASPSGGSAGSALRPPPQWQRYLEKMRQVGTWADQRIVQIAATLYFGRRVEVVSTAQGEILPWAPPESFCKRYGELGRGDLRRRLGRSVPIVVGHVSELHYVGTRSNGRQTVVMACGTGKTLVGIWTAAALWSASVAAREGSGNEKVSLARPTMSLNLAPSTHRFVDEKANQYPFWQWQWKERSSHVE